MRSLIEPPGFCDSSLRKSEQRPVSRRVTSTSGVLPMRSRTAGRRLGSTGVTVVLSGAVGRTPARLAPVSCWLGADLGGQQLVEPRQIDEDAPMRPAADLFVAIDRSNTELDVTAVDARDLCVG